MNNDTTQLYLLFSYIATESNVKVSLNDAMATVEVMREGENFSIYNIVTAERFLLSDVESYKVKCDGAYIDLTLNSGETYEMRVYRPLALEVTSNGRLEGIAWN
jgi:hypothetical protein